MSNDKILVSKEFITLAHRAACGEWKTRIENELPDMFPKGMIGKKVYPRDNSYCINVISGAPGHPAGNFDTQASEVTVISEPYKVSIHGQEKEFVTVLYDGDVFRVLNYLDEKPRPVRATCSMGYSL